MNVAAFFAAIAAALSLVVAAVAIKQLAVYLVPRWRSEIETNTQQSLEEVFLFIPVARLWFLWAAVAVAIAGFVLLWLTWWAAIIAILVWAALPPITYKYYKQKRLKSIDRQLVDALYAIANALRSGAGFVSALEQISKDVGNPLQHELRLLVRQIRFGQSVVESLNEFGQRVPTHTTTFACRVMTIGYEHGGQQAHFLTVLAENLQARLHLQQKMHSLTAQARMQGRIMAVLPVAIFLLLHSIEPEHTQVLLTTTHGYLILAVSTALLGCGYMLCRVILKEEHE